MDWYTALDLLLPERCPLCRGPAERGLCCRCRQRLLPLIKPCPGCALPRPVARCPRKRAEWPLDGVVAPWRFCAPLDRIVHAMKYRGARSHGRALGLLLAASPLLDAAAVDTLVAVPLHRRRLRERGYNQAIEIARPLARALRIPLTARGIRRVVATRPQPGLPRRQRARNVTAAFVVGRRFDGRRVAIVDDVVTSGATICALAATLRSAGAASVVAWAVARTV